MKITQTYLKKLINEEIQKTLNERRQGGVIPIFNLDQINPELYEILKRVPKDVSNSNVFDISKELKKQGLLNQEEGRVLITGIENKTPFEMFSIQPKSTKQAVQLGQITRGYFTFRTESNEFNNLCFEIQDKQVEMISEKYSIDPDKIYVSTMAGEY